MIECKTLDGQSIFVPREKLLFRPAVYAIIFHLDQILLLNTRTTGLYDLPGGGVELGETLDVALRREVKEETGIEIDVGKLRHFSEEFFYYQPTEKAYHNYRFFFNCVPRNIRLIEDHEVDDEEAEKPRWIKTGDLHADKFQSHGSMLMKAINANALEKSHPKIR